MPLIYFMICNHDVYFYHKMSVAKRAAKTTKKLSLIPREDALIKCLTH